MPGGNSVGRQKSREAKESGAKVSGGKRVGGKSVGRQKMTGRQKCGGQMSCNHHYHRSSVAGPLLILICQELSVQRF